MTYVIDTHALLWFLDGNSRLGAQARAVLSDPKSRLVLPATAYAEACWICENGRKVKLPLSKLVSHVAADPRIFIASLNRLVIDRSNSPQTIHEMHDRQIVATAALIAEAGSEVSLLTIDEDIIQSSIVPTLW